MCSLRYEPTVGEEYNPQKPCLGYMETPCSHKYHKVCLERWMQMKMECPTCRAMLPAQNDNPLDSDSSGGEEDIHERVVIAVIAAQ